MKAVSSGPYASLLFSNSMNLLSLQNVNLGCICVPRATIVPWSTLYSTEAVVPQVWVLPQEEHSEALRAIKHDLCILSPVLLQLFGNLSHSGYIWIHWTF